MLKKLILGIILNTFALYAVTHFIDAISYEGGIAFLIIAGIVIGFLNAFIKPIIKVISLPIVFLSGGLFLIIINSGLLWFTKTLFDILAIDGFKLIIEGGIITFLAGGFIFGIINWLEHWIVND